MSTDKFKTIQQFYTFNLDLLLSKGIYPYDYLTDESKFSERELHARKHFYNDLTEWNVNDEDNAHAQAVWSIFIYIRSVNFPKCI